MAPKPQQAAFPEATNHRLVNLMTIACHHDTPENSAALMHELIYGSAVLLVPTEPAVEGQPGVTFTHVDVHEGRTRLLAFTGEAAVLSFAEEYICVGSFLAATLLVHCNSQGIHGIVLDPTTPNEMYIQLGAE